MDLDSRPAARDGDYRPPNQGGGEYRAPRGGDGDYRQPRSGGNDRGACSDQQQKSTVAAADAATALTDQAHISSHTQAQFDSESASNNGQKPGSLSYLEENNSVQNSPTRSPAPSTPVHLVPPPIAVSFKDAAHSKDSLSVTPERNGDGGGGGCHMLSPPNSALKPTSAFLPSASHVFTSADLNSLGHLIQQNNSVTQSDLTYFSTSSPLPFKKRFSSVITENHLEFERHLLECKGKNLNLKFFLYNCSNFSALPLYLQVSGRVLICSSIFHQLQLRNSTILLVAY